MRLELCTDAAHYVIGRPRFLADTSGRLRSWCTSSARTSSGTSRSSETTSRRGPAGTSTTRAAGSSRTTTISRSATTRASRSGRARRCPGSSQRPVLFYAGDGVSDLSATKETDLLFAKAGPC
ncbi:hypothetical protein GGR56DRAFT_630669 [Xylariaceae sp. FL0804]|nr:hypothetical protein GGR56DRAFT_630669 [Xylariaceae sp. FL0804]